MYLEHERFFFLFTSNKKIVNLSHQICFVFSCIAKALRKETESWVQTLVGVISYSLTFPCTMLPACMGNKSFQYFCNDFADFEPEVSLTVREHNHFEQSKKIFSGYISMGLHPSESNSLSRHISWYLDF